MSESARVNHTDLGVLSSYLIRIGPLPPSALELLSELARVRELTRGEHLLQAGEHAQETGVVAEGLLREYFVMSDGTERTKAFVRETQSTGSLADLVSGRPSRAFIVAEEPTRLIALSFHTLRAAIADSPDWLRWTVRMLEIAFINKAEREYELLGLDAAERYDIFGERYPGIEARVAAKHVASYLGITPVHLSRLRRRRRATRQGSGSRKSGA